jgi:hypothetical protein
VARPGSSAAATRSRTRSGGTSAPEVRRERSPFAVSHFESPAHRDLAQDILEEELSWSENGELSGPGYEEAWCAWSGGTRISVGGHSPDARGRDGLRYQLKTLKPRHSSRPEAFDWLGESVTFDLCSIKPVGRLPRGQSFETTSPQALGRMLIAGLNAAMEDWDCFAPLVRIRCKDLKATQMLYWVSDVEPLDPADYVWFDSDRATVCPWERNLHGYRRPEGGSGRATRASIKASGTPELTWSSSSSKLHQRHTIPADADLVHVSDSRVVSKQRARRGVRREITEQVREAAGLAG